MSGAQARGRWDSRGPAGRRRGAKWLHGVEYAADELAEEDLSLGERASIERDVELALEDEITGTEPEDDVEAFVDGVLDDILGKPEDDEERDDETEDDDAF